MECKNIEKYLLKSPDNRLNEDERHELESHLKQCSACETKQHEYQEIRDTLMIKDFPAPKPYFWERLKPRLIDRRSYGLWPLWKQWGIRTIPLSLAIIFFALIVTALLPPTDNELSQSGILLRDQNPFQESIPLLGEEEVDNPNMTLLFTSLEEKNGTRR
jgi:anti-sigma factor RsiW